MLRSQELIEYQNPQYTRLGKAFGTALRKQREEKGVGEEELADAIGLTPIHLRYIEEGKLLPDLFVIVEITRYFGTKLGAFL